MERKGRSISNSDEQLAGLIGWSGLLATAWGACSKKGEHARKIRQFWFARQTVLSRGITCNHLCANRRCVVFLLQDSGGPFSDDDTGRHRVASRHSRHDGSVRNTKAIDAVNPQLSIDHRHRIMAHFRSARLMPVRTEPVSKELLQFCRAHRTG